MVLGGNKTKNEANSRNHDRRDVRYSCHMRKIIALLSVAGCLIVVDGWAQKSKEEPPPLLIDITTLGDAADGVVVRVEFRYELPPEAMAGTTPVIQGSILRGSEVVENFRRLLRPDERSSLRMIRTVGAGEIDVEARLLLDRENDMPLILTKNRERFSIEPTGLAYAAEETDGAEALVAEGATPEISGAIKIRPPRRELAPNLFVVEVEVRDPASRVEFWVDGKKIFTKNAPPYRAELDLGAIPRRVEVRAVGYDSRGRYVDADAWIVNERDTPLEVKITRTVTSDQINHFKISIQNPNNVALTLVSLFAGDRRLAEWTKPPYALDVPQNRLADVSFITATAVAADGYEASDLIYLDGDRYIEQINVNLVELPVTVIDERGVPILDLEKSEVVILEDGRRREISGFAFSENLPLSLGVLVDHSGSMLERIEDARMAAIGFFEEILGEDDRGFFGGFSWETTSLSPFVSDVGNLRRQINEMPTPIGGTALYDAIISGLYKFRPISGRKALVIVTDGEDTASRIPFDDMLTYVRVSRVPIYFIGIGISRLDFSASSKLRGLAAETGGVAYFVRNVDELQKTYEQIETELRSQYLVSYYTESTQKDAEYRLVDVQVSRVGARVRTIRGFIP